MFVLCCRNESERFMLTIIKKLLRKHKLSWLFFCILGLFVRMFIHMFITIAIVLQLGGPNSPSSFSTSIVCLSACLSPLPFFCNQEGPTFQVLFRHPQFVYPHVCHHYHCFVIKRVLTLSTFFFCIIGLFVYVSITITISLQLGGLELSCFFLFIFV